MLATLSLSLFSVLIVNPLLFTNAGGQPARQAAAARAAPPTGVGDDGERSHGPGSRRSACVPTSPLTRTCVKGPCSSSKPPTVCAARAWGAQRIAPGSSGAAVMAASRAGTLNQMLDADSDASDLEVDDDPLDDGGGAIRFKAVDLNDIGLADGDDMSLPPMTLPRDPKVVRTKIRRLQARKTERLQKEGESHSFVPFGRTSSQLRA